MKLQLGSHHVFHPHNHHASSLQSTRSLVDAPSMVERSAATSTTSSSNSQTPAQEQNSDNLIIGLTVAIPISLAIVVLFYLHRRIKRKQRQEDANDKHKSLDFGMDDVVSNKKASARQPKLPEMTVTDMEKSTMDAVNGHNKKGRSLDMNTPYLLPDGSRESLESMSRSMHDQDPYRPVSTARSNTHAPKNDNDSIYTNPFADNASSIVTSSPEREHAPRLQQYSPPAQLPVVEVTQDYEPYVPPAVLSVNVDPPEEFDNPFQLTPPSPPAHQQSHPAAAAASLSIAIPPTNEPVGDDPAVANNRLSTVQSGDKRRVSVMGLRPLPPDDPADNPEQRANRIRSFYKEYFDDSKPNPTGIYPQYNPYADNYEAEFYEDGAVYDADTGAFIGTHAPPGAPFAKPMGRSAMTPEPTGAVGRRMRSNTASLQSTGHIDIPAFRSPRPAPKKTLPPPAALQSLPTPYKLQGDDLAFLNPADFAPKPTFRDQQLGRGPDSPLGVARPYSPAVRVATPLVRSFDDLAALPSPHLLRKSGTFTSLDFAPPPRFRGAEGGGSDAGSIRSNHSGISAIQSQAIRSGAYRVSRLPAQMVGTKDDLAMSLKPSWELRGVNPGTT